ncbi:MAG: substrate-binding domain-containing protein [Eubacterium sp.]
MMKKVLACLLVGVLSIGLLAGCGGKKDDGGQQAEAPKTSAEAEAPKDDASGDQPFIGISVPKASTGWTAAVTFYAEKYCKDNNLNYKLVQAESTNDQANQVDELISQKPDAIVLLPINDELATAAQTIKDAGITLVNFDRTLGATEPDYYLAGDNPGCGTAGADWMVKTLGEEFNVVICSVTSWGNIAEERKEGFKTRLAEIAPNAKVINEYASESASQEDGLKLMTDVLQSNPEIDAVFLVDDEQACGALQAIQEAGRTDIKALYAAGGGATNFLNRIPDSAFPIASVGYYPSMIADAIGIAVDVSTGAASHDARTIEEAVVISAENLDEWKASIGYDPDAPY